MRLMGISGWYWENLQSSESLRNCAMKTSDIPDMAGLYPADTSQKPVTKEKNLPVFQRQLSKSEPSLKEPSSTGWRSWPKHRPLPLSSSIISNHVAKPSKSLTRRSVCIIPCNDYVYVSNDACVLVLMSGWLSDTAVKPWTSDYTILLNQLATNDVISKSSHQLPFSGAHCTQ